MDFTEWIFHNSSLARWQREQRHHLIESISSRLTGKSSNIWPSYFQKLSSLCWKKKITYFRPFQLPDDFRDSQLLKENNSFYLYRQKETGLYIRYALQCKWEIYHCPSTHLSSHSFGTQLLAFPGSVLQAGVPMCLSSRQWREGDDSCDFQPLAHKILSHAIPDVLMPSALCTLASKVALGDAKLPSGSLSDCT